jgi:hypothetical protein
MKDVGSWRCQKYFLCLLTTGRLMGVTVNPLQRPFLHNLILNKNVSVEVVTAAALPIIFYLSLHTSRAST